jgi:hypothetical protein
VSYPTIPDAEDIYAHEVSVIVCGFIGKGIIYFIGEK